MGNRQDKRGRRLGQTADSLELELFQTIVELTGYQRVLIENHRGVISYGKEKIIVKVRYGSVLICGCNLEIVHMTREQLVILGNIQNVTLHRRDRN